MSKRSKSSSFLRYFPALGTACLLSLGFFWRVCWRMSFQFSWRPALVKIFTFVDLQWVYIFWVKELCFLDQWISCSHFHNTYIILSTSSEVPSPAPSVFFPINYFFSLRLTCIFACLKFYTWESWYAWFPLSNMFRITQWPPVHFPANDTISLFLMAE